MNTRISALVDGELEASEANGAIATLARNEEQKSLWSLYHVIGDALQHESDLAIDVSGRVMAALSSEITVLSPRPQRSTRRWQRQLVALAASAAGVAVVAWIALAPAQIPVMPGSLTAANQAVVSPELPRLAVMDTPSTRAKVAVSSVSETPALSAAAEAKQAARLQEYLMAHQAYEGGALVGGASHIRTVSVLGVHR